MSTAPPKDPSTSAEVGDTKIAYLGEELHRLLNSENRKRDEISAAIEAAGVTKSVDIAADKVEALTNSTSKSRVYISFLRALSNAAEKNEPNDETFARLYPAAVRTLSQMCCSLTQQSTSWQVNAENRASIAAHGEVVALFLDIVAIK